MDSVVLVCMVWAYRQLPANACMGTASSTSCRSSGGSQNYVKAGEYSVSEHLRQLSDARISLLAVDGDVTADVSGQIDGLPAEATHLVVSVGGNDALGCISVLDSKVSTVRQALAILSRVRHDFRADYRNMVERLPRVNLPVVVCTIYKDIPGLPEGDVPQCTFQPRIPLPDQLLMKLRLGLHLDGQRGWHPANRLGYATVGPLGMLGILEAQLGVPVVAASQSERIVQYRDCLYRADEPGRFYHRSFAADELGTAATLLGWRDQWHLNGWSADLGGAGSQRLRDMAAVEQLARSTVAVYKEAIERASGKGPTRSSCRARPVSSHTGENAHNPRRTGRCCCSGLLRLPSLLGRVEEFAIQDGLRANRCDEGVWFVMIEGLFGADRQKQLIRVALHWLEAILLIETDCRSFRINDKTYATNLLGDSGDSVYGVEQQELADVSPLMFRGNRQSPKPKCRNSDRELLLADRRKVGVHQLDKIDCTEPNDIAFGFGFGSDKGHRNQFSLVLLRYLAEPPVEIVISAIKSTSVVLVT